MTWMLFGQNYERGDDPDEKLREAQQAFDEYRSEMSGLQARDLDFGLYRIESATTLTGPEQSVPEPRSPEYARGYLINTVRAHSEKTWRFDLLKRPCDRVDAVVHFDDGTKVRLVAEAMSIDFFSGDFIGFEYHVEVPDEPSEIRPHAH